MELNLEEALRYAGVPSPPPAELRREMAEVAAGLTAAVPPRWRWRLFELEHTPEGPYLPELDLLLPGRTAALMLEECAQAALLACTLGAVFDARLRALQARDMARAVLLDGCGSAWVEAGCDAAEEEISGRLPGRFLTDRFSPGYGDLPLSLQPALCGALDAQRTLGLCVTDSCLLNPGKSVTALLGVADRPQMARVRGCRYCSMNQTCQLRKGGKSCGLS